MRRTAIGAIPAALFVSSAAMSAETTAYVYDALGRLVTVTHSGTVNNGLQTTYTHDPADNRARVTVTGSTNPPPH